MPWVPPALDPAPDPRLTRAFAGCLPGHPLGGPLLAFASVPSTQLVGRELAGRGGPEGIVVLADHQTAGRGQRGRSWTAPAGSALLLSCVLRPALAAARWPELTLAAAAAVAEAIRATTGVTPRVKWPNDVLVGERKLAGILAEGVVGPAPGGSFVVLGIGVNVAQRDEDWPAELRDGAVSLAQLDRRVPRSDLLAAVLDRLAARYGALMVSDRAPAAGHGSKAARSPVD